VGASFSVLCAVVMGSLPLEKRAASPEGRRILPVHAGSAVMTLPVIAYNFQRLSMVSLLVYPVVMPVQTPLMILGGLAILAGMLWRPLGRAISYQAGPFIPFTNRYIELFARIPGGNLALGSTALVAVIGIYLLLLALTIWRAQAREKLLALSGKLDQPHRRERLSNSSICFICLSLNGPKLIVVAFSSTFWMVLNPGIGIVVLLRAQIQAKAPCVTVLPSQFRTSRIRSSFLRVGINHLFRTSSIDRQSSAANLELILYFPVSIPLASGHLLILACPNSSQTDNISGASSIALR
jgi:hypothetical protein